MGQNTTIACHLNRLSPGNARRAGTLLFIPIRKRGAETKPAYGIFDGTFETAAFITEVSEAGSVQQLLVDNRSPIPLFLLDGQQLRGAKQNRVVNADVLVPAGTKLVVPVSCVESKRWRYDTHLFHPEGTASNRIRAGKSSRVHRSLSTKGTHDADQHAVWADVELTLTAAAAVGSSPTRALSDAYSLRDEELRKVRESVLVTEDAVGLAVFKAGKFLGLDVFDCHSTLRRFWNWLVDSYAVDHAVIEHNGDVPVMGSKRTSPAVPAKWAVNRILRLASVGNWNCFPTPGYGEDLRLEDRTLSGAALNWVGHDVIHLQLFARKL